MTIPATTIPATLSIVTLGVADLAVAEAFYAALGWQRASSSVDGVIAWFDLGGVWLGVYPERELALDSGLAPAAGAAPSFRGSTLAINLTSAEAVDDALAAALAAGATLTLAAAATDYGVYHACFADPDGHVWEVAHSPLFPIVDGRTVIP